MVDRSVPPTTSMRERKKERTRRALVDAAVDLCVRQGYENTTVEQISAVADVSPRTFSRYFSSKETVFIAVLDDLADEITAELTAQAPALPMEALRSAFVAVLTRLADRPLSGLTTERLVLILQVGFSSPTLRQAAIDYRSPVAMAALARHMGVSADDPKLDLAVSLFSTTIVSACSDLIVGDPGEPPGPEVVLERLEETLRHVAAVAADLHLPSRGEPLPAHSQPDVRNGESDHRNDRAEDGPRGGVGHGAARHEAEALKGEQQAEQRDEHAQTDDDDAHVPTLAGQRRPTSFSAD